MLKENPFTPAKQIEKRLKVFLYGESGAGKSTLALQFPNPVVIDLERGVDLYADKFTFDKIDTVGAQDVLDAVVWLDRNDHDYKTLIIDPITVYWDALQKETADLRLAQKTKGKPVKGEAYDLQFKDWGVIKGQYKGLMRLLISLDMNVVLTAHQKAEYVDGAMAQLSGNYTFAAEKSTDYLFDVVLRLRKQAGKFVSEVAKDRTGKLPTDPFVTSFSVFAERFNGTTMDRKAVPYKHPTEEQVAELNELTQKFTIDNVQSALATYGVKEFEQLSREQAETIINKLKKG